ncbi:uncharacterized protein LOC62_02G002244 [Vanrija pseudolonga]|uniref:Uncharacterized protein n=1 Tax=Vanrija pseudolonga TaxID=143232 RepID=A0AAF1BJS2_9TREE|nr:hypothetical protein LOC62_02G002244 [Vanrija pseudolonga]
MSLNCSYPYNPNVTCLHPHNISANGVAYVLLRDDQMDLAGWCLLDHNTVFTNCVTQSKERRKALGLPSGTGPTLGPLPLILLVLAFVSAVSASVIPRAISCSSFEPDPRDAWNWNAYTQTRLLGGGGAISCNGLPCGGSFNDTKTTYLSWQLQNTSVSINVNAKPADVVKVVGGTDAEQVTSVPAKGLWLLHGIGIPATYAYAVDVPGWYSGCSDRQRYRGSALVPDSDRIVLYYLITD